MPRKKDLDLELDKLQQGIEDEKRALALVQKRLREREHALANVQRTKRLAWEAEVGALATKYGLGWCALDDFERLFLAFHDARKHASVDKRVAVAVGAQSDL